MTRTFSFVGQEMELFGAGLKPGDKAPAARLVRTDMTELNIADTSGVRIFAALPSLDTGVCDRETRTFNEKAAQLPDVSVYVVSMDLPYAQRRWCGAAGIERVVTLSDYRYREFGQAWDTLIVPNQLLARATFVVDSAGVVTFAEYLTSGNLEPDYDAVLAAARSAR